MPLGTLRKGIIFSRCYSSLQARPSWQCTQKFSRKSDLCRHYRIHTNDRPYYCTVENCNRRFIQRSALTIHFRTHTGEKPHICAYKGCRRAFADVGMAYRNSLSDGLLREYSLPAYPDTGELTRESALTSVKNRTVGKGKTSMAPKSDLSIDCHV